jgi:hypothetical protein
MAPARRASSVGTVGERCQAVHLARAGERHERHDLLVARLEAHGRPRGNIEPHAPCLGAVEGQRLVRLEEVVVRPHLDRPVPRIRDRHLRRRPTDIGLDVPLFQEILAGNHGSGDRGAQRMG